MAGSGHNSYAKSIQVHIQQLVDLRYSNADVYDQFLKGQFIAHRTIKRWGGLSPDLIIEQVLMKTIKSNSGLTRRRGMDEDQRQLWVQAMIPASEMNDAMQSFTGLKYSSSEQHNESTASRQNRNFKDLKKVVSFLALYDPFSGPNSLRNICTGKLQFYFAYFELIHVFD